MRSPVGCAPSFGLLTALVLAGCGLGQSGINPPVDQIFLPGGLAIDPSGHWLFVINSNNDLRFNAGTVLPLDLQRAKSHLQSGWPECSTTHFTNDKAPETLAGTLDQPCCIDRLRPHVLNCNERAYAQADATVQIGSFAGATAIQAFQNPNGDFRMFMAVRADPSITFIDVTHPSGPDGPVNLRCTGPRGGPPPQARNPFCDDNWRIRRPSGAEIQDNVLPEEPHSLALDPNLGILYVGHLTIAVHGQTLAGGISTIDIAALEDPNAPNGISSIARVVFPTSTTQGVSSLSLLDPLNLSLIDPGDPRVGDKAPGRLYAVALASPDITEMVLQCQSPGQICDPSTPSLRDLSLVPSEQIKSSAFLPSGNDIRGFLLSSPDGNQAYVLHRNTPDVSTSTDPAALVVLDRRLGEDGEPANLPSAILEICSGATNMKFHDAGRGSLLFITCFEGGEIYVVDPQAPLVVAQIEAGHGPTALTFSPTDKTIAYLAEYADNDVSVIDLAPGSPTEYMVVQRLGFPHAVTE